MKQFKKIGVVLFILILLSISFWKVPVYWLLSSVRLPEGCEDFRAEVIYSDVYEPHILGERVMIAVLDQHALETFITENNPAWLANRISIAPFFGDWDDFAVSRYDCESLISPAEKDSYFVIRYYQTVSPFQ